ncbi:C-type lectin domain family 2 member E-like isoform X2 [Microtus pennsylvanicus]|uniref:C-type lectin domain family 2 member E-like isoform X2 n=1 Tax=Microtus pennsylvanicus TaxID=10058 RepID=UPI003F6B21C0
MSTAESTSPGRVGENRKKLQEKCLKIFSPVSPAWLYCCYAVIIVLIGAVIVLSIALSLSDKEQQGQHLRIVSPVSPARLHCCYAVIMVLTAAVIALSVALSLSVRKEEMAIASPEAVNGTCPRNWIGFGSKCFYFSEHTSNWTYSETSCMEQGGHLTQFDSLEELNFLQRYKGDSTAWIGLHRESSEHPWKWTDNTEYNNLVPIRGEGNHAYLSGRGISSGRNYISRKWICSKPSSYTLQCAAVSQLV